MKEAMRKRAWLAAVFLLGVLLAPGVNADQSAADAFAKLKSLAGEWHGKDNKGKPATLSIKVVAGGHTVMEEYNTGKPEQGMFTLYHLDGDHLMLTHYCTSNNQPRMRADLSGDPNVLRFEFFDSTNLQNPQAGHMRRAIVRLIDQDHLANQWAYFIDGKAAFDEEIAWVRAR